jgi:hypothetical protein
VRIAGLASLRELRLLDVDSVRFPADLWQLLELRIVYTFGCKMGKLPDNIPASAKLERLDLLSGYLRRLPSSLCALSNLTSLDIWDAVFEALPDHLSQLTSLRILNVSARRVTRLPPNLDRLTNLEEVKLTHISGIGRA